MASAAKKRSHHPYFERLAKRAAMQKMSAYPKYLAYIVMKKKSQPVINEIQKKHR
jgi:hypothetical protein